MKMVKLDAEEIRESVEGYLDRNRFERLSKLDIIRWIQYWHGADLKISFPAWGEIVISRSVSRGKNKGKSQSVYLGWKT